MGGSSTTSTSTSGSASPIVTENVDKLVGKVGALSEKDYPVFNKSLYPGMSSTTQGGIQGLLNASNNGIYANGVNNALNYTSGLAAGPGTSLTEQNLMGMTGAPGASLTEQNLMGTASGSGPSLSEQQLIGVAQGQQFGTDAPGYARLRDNAAKDALTSVNSMFSNSGRLGSGLHVQSASEGVADALAGLDYANYQNDIARQERALGTIEGQRQQGLNNQMSALGQIEGQRQQGLANQFGALNAIEGQRQQGLSNTFAAQASLPGLLDAASAPAQMQLTAGGLLDADASAKRQGEQDLFMRREGAPYTQLGQLSSILAGTAPSAGTVTTNTQPAPNPFLGLLGAGLAFL